MPIDDEIERNRAELQRLRMDIDAARQALDSMASAQLLEANEQLTLAAMRDRGIAQAATDTAAAALESASRSAELDPLTDLPNRVLLRDRLAQAIGGAKRRGTRAALLFVDLDHFKQVNGTLGHAAGDQVLKVIATRLAASVRAVDTVSRHGGDEFLVLLSDIGEAADAAAIADKLSAAIDLPVRMGERSLRLGASIGVGVYPEDGEDADTLIAAADAAMYRVKHRAAGAGVRAASPVQARVQAAPRVERDRRYRRMQEANENMVHAALSAQALQRASDQRRSRMTDVFAIVAHELRNALAPLRTAVSVLRAPQPEAPAARRVHLIIERQVSHLTRLVDDLVDASRAQAARFSIERRSVDVRSLIEEAVEGFGPTLQARRQSIDLQLAVGVPRIEADAVRLMQVLSNLLDNASRYTPAGGALGVSLTNSHDRLVIAVSDEGAGIAADALASIFDPFVQAAPRPGLDASGLGLGLSIVRALVVAHGGTVVARSAGPGAGSRFEVTLPLAAVAAAAASPHPSVST